MERANARHVKNINELKDFAGSEMKALEAAGKDIKKAKILGTKDGKLYVSPGGFSKLLGRITGTRAKEREYAKETIKKLAENMPEKDGRKAGILYSMGRRIQEPSKALNVSDVYKTAEWAAGRLFGPNAVADLPDGGPYRAQPIPIPADTGSRFLGIDEETESGSGVESWFDSVQADLPSEHTRQISAEAAAVLSLGKKGDQEDDLIAELASVKPKPAIDPRLMNGFSRIGQNIAAGKMTDADVKEIMKGLVAHPDLDTLANPIAFNATITKYIKAGLEPQDAHKVEVFLQENQVLGEAFAEFQTQRPERELVPSNEEEIPVSAPSKSGRDDASLGKLKQDMQKIGETLAGGEFRNDEIVNAIATAFFARVEADPAERANLTDSEGGKEYFRKQATDLMKEGLPEFDQEPIDTFLEASDFLGKAIEKFQWNNAKMPVQEDGVGSPRAKRELYLTLPRLSSRAIERSPVQEAKQSVPVRTAGAASKLTNAAIGIAELLKDSPQELESAQHKLAADFLQEAMRDSDKGYARALAGRDDFMRQTRPALSDTLSEPDLTEFVDESFRLAANRLLDSEMLGESSNKIKRSNGKPLHDLELGGTTYKPVVVLGRGGEGEAFLYADDKDHVIAVKISKAITAEAKSAAAREALLNKKASMNADGTRNPYVVGFEGVALTEDNEIYHAMEYMPNGDLKDAFGLIDFAVADGMISQIEADVISYNSMSQAARALESLHAKNQLHRDFKAENLFLDADGEARAGDFGTAAEGSVRPLAELAVDAPQTLPPEILFQRAKLELFNRALKEKFDKTVLGRIDELQRAAGITMPEARTLVLGSDVTKIDRRNIEGEVKAFSDTQSSNKESDIWSLGIVFAEAMRLPGFVNAGFGSTMEERLLRYYNDPSIPAIAPPGMKAKASGELENGSLFESTYSPALDALLTRMFDREPKNRPSAAEVADHRLFKQRGIGAPETAALMSALLPAAPAARKRRNLDEPKAAAVEEWTATLKAATAARANAKSALDAVTWEAGKVLVADKLLEWQTSATNKVQEKSDALEQAQNWVDSADRELFKARTAVADYARGINEAKQAMRVAAPDLAVARASFAVAFRNPARERTQSVPGRQKI